MQTSYPQHHALVALLAYTGLRFCHASALHLQEDWDETACVLRIHRKNVRGKLGSVTRKKRAPKEYPVLPEAGRDPLGTPRAARGCGRGES